MLAHIEAPSGESPIELRSLEVDARVTGLQAETTQTMVFYNPNNRPLEGNLVFPLPDGAVVCGYALDVEGRMVDGVIVAKQEARRVLEAEIRKGVDPGLVEQVRGNVYRTRVYPLPVRGTRTLRITYVSELTVEDNAASYHLPLPHGANLENVSLKIQVLQSPVDPVLTGGSGHLRLTRFDRAWVAEAQMTGADLSDDLHVRLPDLPDVFANVERNERGETFFCLSALTPPVPVGRWQPRRVAVAWDGSMSRLGVQQELDLLLGLDEVWPHTAVDVVVFRDRREQTREFPDFHQAVQFLRQLPFDGGTNLTELQLDRPPAGADAWLLCSDGLDTISPGLPELGGIPIFCVTEQVSNDNALLSYLAEQTGGTFLNLLRVSVPTALEILAQGPSAQAAPVCRGARDTRVSRHYGRVQVLGRLDNVAEVSIEGLRPIRVDAHDALPGHLLARAWAAREATALQVQGAESEMLVELGRRYGLVTPGSSLLVLESLEQYLEYDIEPPASLPALQAQFHELRRNTERDEERERKSRLDRVVSMWKERVSWWETDYRPHWQPKAEQPKKKGSPRTGSLAPPPAEALSMDLFGSAEVFECEPSMEPEVAFCSEEVADDAFAFPVAMAPGDFPGAMPPPAPPSPAPGAAPMAMAAARSAPLMAEPAPAPAAGGGGMSRLAQLEEAGGAAQQPASIAIQGWDPQTPYLDRLRESADPYASYLDARQDYLSSPSFFLDCADYLLKEERREEGLRVLSNILELGLEEPALMRIVSWRLQQAGELDKAVIVLEEVLKLRPDEPQSHRDLALVLGERWEREGEAADAYRSAELLYHVVLNKWDRFPEIELIALMELNRLLARAEGLPMPEIDPRLKKLLDLDLRISLSWDADLTDVDLHVWEPTGEHCYYGSNRTRIGGLVSRDFRDGYGPEEYILRRAFPGEYKIQANYYASHQQTLTGACTVIATVFTDYGRPEEKRQLLTLRLDQPGHTVDVGTITSGQVAVGG